MRTAFAAAVVCFAVVACAVYPSHAQGTLENVFHSPPEAARPMTWWHWMNGNVTKQGITADLEAMKRIGLGGAQIFNVAQGEPVGPVKFMSPEWRELTKHAISEANRLGLKLAIHNCAGWSESGGPWITPDQSMQRVVWSETYVHGGSRFTDALPQPNTVLGSYHDIAVLAFPTLPGDGVEPAKLQAVVTASIADVNGASLFDNDPNTMVQLPLPTQKPQYLQIAFREPVTCASLRVACRGNDGPSAGRLEASNDGRTFWTVAPLAFSTAARSVGGTASFPATKAKVYRVLMTRAGRSARRLAVTEIGFGSMRIPQIAEKSGVVPNARLTFSRETWPAAMTIARSSIIDLTVRLRPDGRLVDWTVPPGDWTIIRFGHTSTGQPNAPAPDSGRGLECDKMSRAAVEAHFNGMMAKVIADSGPLAGKSLKYVLADSWEAGTQNWTPAFRDEFRKRMGYDLTTWLPTLTGRVVDGLDQSERVLWDFRRVIADLISENHYAFIHDLCSAHGLQFTAEAPGIGMPTIADELQCKGDTDMPMGEFWLDGHNDSKEAATSAHIYGKKRASAEAFTAVTRDAKWMKAPFDHKAIGDLNFCRGINLFVFHRYAMQPWLDRAPGMTMGPWGTNFERTNTWWEQARAWMQYLSRSQALLQEGLFVADACYYYGEGAPNTIVPERGALTPPLPEGYDFDACDTTVLLGRMKVVDGRIMLPDGMSYRVLVLPNADRLTPRVLEKVRDLVQDGATVVGPRPERSPSLANFPQCDDTVKRLADQIWGDADGKQILEHRLGRGKVVWGKPMETVLAEVNAPADVETSADSRIVWIHRRSGDADIYFVSNQEPFATSARVTFRAGARRPELWSADTGQMASAAQFSVKDGRVTVPLRFDPAGSIFVVFRHPVGTVDPVTALQRDGRDIPFDEPVSPAGKLVIESAVYGVNPERNEQSVDITRQLQSAVHGGRLRATASNEIAGDPALNVVKRLRVVYTLNGVRHEASVDENASIEIPARADLGPEAKPSPPAAEVTLRGERGYLLRVSEPGVYTLRTAAGRTKTVKVPAIPSPETVTGSWDVRFPPKWGAPDSITLDSLISWTARPEEGVRHFSGTATYEKDIDLSGIAPSEGRSLWLDLGTVKEVAEVKLNGKNLGILWKPPFRVDITGAAHPGRNHLEIRITNLWPNRLIGDAALPIEKRYTFATFQPFTAADPLLESGLLGPVTLQTTESVTVR